MTQITKVFCSALTGKPGGLALCAKALLGDRFTALGAVKGWFPVGLPAALHPASYRGTSRAKEAADRQEVVVFL